MNKPKTCPFCQGRSKTAISGEHMLPSWAKEILPQRPMKREFLSKGIGFFEIKQITKDDQRQGAPSGIKARIPCITCNNGWMSVIEETAKPILLGLGAQGKRQLSRIERRTLGQWLFLKYSVRSASASKPALTANDYSSFMEKRVIPNGFHCWVFRHNVDYWKDGARWQSARTFTMENGDDNFHNVSSFCQGFCDLLFLSVHTWATDTKLRFVKEQATKIWPLGAQGGATLPQLELDGTAAAFVAHIWTNLLDVGVPAIIDPIAETIDGAIWV